jgi:hypothetical protein
MTATSKWPTVRVVDVSTVHECLPSGVNLPE